MERNAHCKEILFFFFQKLKFMIKLQHWCKILWKIKTSGITPAPGSDLALFPPWEFDLALDQVQNSHLMW